jgi:hypothetical protein
MSPSATMTCRTFSREVTLGTAKRCVECEGDWGME